MRKGAIGTKKSEFHRLRSKEKEKPHRGNFVTKVHRIVGNFLPFSNPF